MNYSFSSRSASKEVVKTDFSAQATAAEIEPVRGALVDAADSLVDLAAQLPGKEFMLTVHGTLATDESGTREASFHLSLTQQSPGGGMV